MVRLGEDADGTWLYAARGAAASYAEHGPTPLPVSFLTLLPRGDQWWIATWMRDNEEIDIDLYVDIIQPPRWVGGGTVRIVDLDLDVIRRSSGEVLLDDEDELELHALTLHYPREVVGAARATGEAVLAAVAQGKAPFSQPPDRWLAAARAAGLAS
ncbi:MAG TPA: DUF402 domain-containing protein [Acidimicrobiales bacterium]|nr:DUF402 domain-containing protein [Acidimicrobiales bacterium]